MIFHLTNDLHLPILSVRYNCLVNIQLRMSVASFLRRSPNPSSEIRNTNSRQDCKDSKVPNSDNGNLDHILVVPLVRRVKRVSRGEFLRRNGFIKKPAQDKP